MLDLTQLRTFVAVLQEGHLTRAAERLHISQPTASNHIRSLEHQFGVQLFLRTTRGLEPTPAGRRLAERAAQTLASSMELTCLARELQGSPSGRLAIGTVEEPPLLAQLPALATWVHSHFPLVELSFESRNSLSIRHGLATGDIDAGFFVGSTIGEDLAGFQIRPQEFVVAGPHAWRDRLADATPAALAALPWIVTRAGSSNAELAERLFRPHGLKARSVMEVSNDVLLRSMVKGGVGIGFVRRQLAEEGAAAGTLCLVPWTMSTTGLQFAYSRVRAADPLLELLVRAMAETGMGQAGQGQVVQVVA